MHRGALGLWLLASAAFAGPHEHAPPVVLAPGYADLEFSPPAPGSYELPPLGTAADGVLLDSSGAAVRLHDLLDGKITVLSFIFTRCSDVNGCPLANFLAKHE